MFGTHSWLAARQTTNNRWSTDQPTSLLAETRTESVRSSSGRSVHKDRGRTPPATLPQL